MIWFGAGLATRFTTMNLTAPRIPSLWGMYCMGSAVGAGAPVGWGVGLLGAPAACVGISIVVHHFWDFFFCRALLGYAYLID